MSARRDALAERREHLLRRSATLREELRVDGRALALRFRLADRVLAVARSGPLRALLIGAAALALFGKPRRLFKTASRLLMLWPLLRPFLPKLIDVLRGPPARHDRHERTDP